MTKKLIPIELNNGQREAYTRILDFIENADGSMYLLAGYAGTGKTFLVGKILRYIFDKHSNWKVAVTAPDGTVYVPKKALRDAIYATKDHKGLTGTLSCGQYGDCGAPIIAVYQVTAENVANLSLPTKPIWPTR